MCLCLLRARSESLYLPMIFMNLVTAMMWVVYGLVGRPDPMVWAPNFIGVLLAVAQVGSALSWPLSSPLSTPHLGPI